jgi:hypothetical protein
MKDFIAHGHKVDGKRVPTAGLSLEFDTKIVRKWAQANGIDVSSHGRIPAEVVERNKAAIESRRRQ